MSLASQEKARLIRNLKKRGEDVVLQRTTGNNQAWVAVTCRAFVRGFKPEQLTSAPGASIIVGDSSVVISSQEIDEINWPGDPPPAPALAGDQRVPVRGDRMIVAGKTRAVIGAEPIYLDGMLIRINVQVR